MTSRRYPALSLNRETFKAYALIIDAYGFPQRIWYLSATEAIRKNTASLVQSSDHIYNGGGLRSSLQGDLRAHFHAHY